MKDHQQNHHHNQRVATIGSAQSHGNLLDMKAYGHASNENLLDSHESPSTKPSNTISFRDRINNLRQDMYGVKTSLTNLVDPKSNQQVNNSELSQVSSATNSKAARRPINVGKRASLTGNVISNPSNEQDVDKELPYSTKNSSSVLPNGNDGVSTVANAGTNSDQQPAVIPTVVGKTSGVGLKVFNRMPSEAVMQKIEKDMTRLNLLSTNPTSGGGAGYEPKRNSMGATTGTSTSTYQPSTTTATHAGYSNFAGKSNRTKPRHETDSGYISKDTNKSEFEPSTIEKSRGDENKSRSTKEPSLSPTGIGVSLTTKTSSISHSNKLAESNLPSSSSPRNVNYVSPGGDNNELQNYFHHHNPPHQNQNEQQNQNHFHNYQQQQQQGLTHWVGESNKQQQELLTKQSSLHNNSNIADYTPQDYTNPISSLQTTQANNVALVRELTPRPESIQTLNSNSSNVRSQRSTISDHHNNHDYYQNYQQIVTRKLSTNSSKETAAPVHGTAKDIPDEILVSRNQLIATTKWDLNLDEKVENLYENQSVIPAKSVVSYNYLKMTQPENNNSSNNSSSASKSDKFRKESSAGVFPKSSANGHFSNDHGYDLSNKEHDRTLDDYLATQASKLNLEETTGDKYSKSWGSGSNGMLKKLRVKFGHANAENRNGKNWY